MRLDFNNLTEEQENQLSDVGFYGMDRNPAPLQKASLDRIGGWVYDRRYGVFACSSSSHCFVMSRILAWDLGYEDWMEIDNESIALQSWRHDPQEYAEYWLINTPGTAFRSSVSSKIMAGRRGNLNEQELDYFYPVEYVKAA